MKARRAEQAKPRMFAAYLEGEVTPSEAAAIEAELADSPRARRRIARLREIREALSAPIPEIEAIDLVVDWRRVATGRSTRAGSGWRRFGGVLAVAAAGVAVAGVALRKQASEEFRAKSAAPSVPLRERWAGIRVYHVDGTSEAKRLVDRLRATDGLLFSYTNLGPRPLDHLMVFGVDAHGEVRWFYPAYNQEGTNPTSIVVKKGEADVPLPDLIHHDLAPGPLAIHALFTDRPLGVLEVEALLREQPDRSAPLPLPDAVEQVIATWVDP